MHIIDEPARPLVRRLEPEVLAAHRLPDGRCARLRALHPGETDTIQAVFDQMSGQSRFLRFHSPTPRLTRGALRALAAVEPGRHLAVVAEVQDHPVAVARWVRLAGEPGAAELAADVADRYQGAGLGRALAAQLALSAGRAGIRHFRCSVHPENRTTQAFLSRLGARRDPHEPDDLLLPVGVFTTQTGLAVVPRPRRGA